MSCIYKRGEGRWAIILEGERDPKTGKRKQHWHTIKGTYRQAQARLHELSASLQKGDYVEPSKLTVADYVRSRIAQWAASGRISPKTTERYTELIDNQIAPHIGAVPIQKLKASDIEGWHTSLKIRGRKDGKGGVSNRTISHAHRVLSKALRDAVRHNIVSKNVAAEERAPAVAADEMIILTPEQVRDLPVKLNGQRMYARAITALYTGMRPQELLALRWNALDLNAKPPTVAVSEALEGTKQHGLRFKGPKTASGRRQITLPDIVVDVLREHKRQQLEERMALGLGRPSEDALVFPALRDPSLPQAPDAFSAEWRDAADKIGLCGVPLYSLRHTHASQLIDEGVDVVTISKRLGHASPAITLKVYAHLFRKDDGKAAEAINRALQRD
jgi:integrase